MFFYLSDFFWVGGNDSNDIMAWFSCWLKQRSEKKRINIQNLFYHEKGLVSFNFLFTPHLFRNVSKFSLLCILKIGAISSFKLGEIMVIELLLNYYIPSLTTNFTLRLHQITISLPKPSFRQLRSLSRIVDSSYARKVGSWWGIW